MIRLEALAVGKACPARLYSYSRLKKREPLIALGSHQGVLNFCIHSTPLRFLEQRSYLDYTVHVSWVHGESGIKLPTLRFQTGGRHQNRRPPFVATVLVLRPIHSTVVKKKTCSCISIMRFKYILTESAHLANMDLEGR